MSAFRPLVCFLATFALLQSAVRAQVPWDDSRYMNRLPLTFTNTSGHSYAAGDVIAASIPYTVVAGRIKADGSDAVVYYGGAALPSRALVMGGSVKVLMPLQNALGTGLQQTGYWLYFSALGSFPAPPLPAGVQGWDFSDGSLHGWKSLQNPNGSTDVKIAADGTFGNALVMDNSLYHHPIAFASTMTPQAEGTVYTKIRTGGGENEACAFQRFTTQNMEDEGGNPYLSGGSVAGTGIAVDSYGSMEMLVTVGMGSPEGSDQHIHPGPGALDPGADYVASSDNFQYLVTATRDADGQTTVYGDAWQAPVASTGGAGDPLSVGFKMSRATNMNESQQPLNAGVVGIMSYYSTLKLHWMYSVPNAWAEFLATTGGAVETSSGPGPGRAIIQGVTYYQPNGVSATVGGLAVTVRDASNNVLATGTSGPSGDYRLIVTAAPTASTITASASGSGTSGSASSSVIENSTVTLNVPVTFASQVTGRVTDTNGAPVQGAVVGRALDGYPWVITGADGRYTLPAPAGTTVVVGAQKEGTYLSGPRWITGTTADFTLLPASTDLLAGKTPTILPSGSAATATGSLTDGDLTTVWTSGSVDAISTSNPLRLTFDLNNATVSEVDVHWKQYPTAWHVEMTNSAGARTYYEAGETTANERGGFIAPGSTDRHVIAVKTAAVTGVTSISIVVTGVSGSDPISAYGIVARPDNPTTIADAAAAMRIAGGFQAAPKDNNAFYRWNAHNDDSKINFLDAVELVKDLGREVKPLRVFVINYVPVVEAEGNKTVGQIFGWSNPYTNTENHRVDMELASHDYLRIYLLPQVTVDEYPIFDNGYRFTDSTFTNAWRTRTFPAGHCDENAMIQEFDLVRRVDCGDIDEIWVQAVPGFAMWETTMAGPGAYWCNSGPVSGTNGNRLFVMTFFNYERQNDVMLEDWGHRSESILGVKVYGNWDSASERTTWDKFTRYDKIAPGRASCGNVHFPPNGTSDYDYANPTLVSSDADDWLNYPNFTGARKLMNRSNWATPYAGDYHRNYHIWWYQRMPHIPGVGPDGKQANWWKYIVDMNSYPESR